MNARELWESYQALLFNDEALGVSVQPELPWQMLVEAAYVGTHGVKILENVNLNEVPDAVASHALPRRLPGRPRLTCRRPRSAAVSRTTCGRRSLASGIVRMPAACRGPAEVRQFRQRAFREVHSHVKTLTIPEPTVSGRVERIG